MQTRLVNFYKDTNLLTIELNRPLEGNILNEEMCLSIISELENLSEDIKLVKICASGEDFCTGRESPMPSLGPHPSGEKIRKKVTALPLRLYDAIKNTRIPTISIIQGKASGAGCALACVCDVNFASINSVFDVNELDRDIPPTLVMHALIGKIPIKTLAHIVLSREKIIGSEAVRVGLVTKVYESSELKIQSDLFIKKLLKNSVQSLSAVKQFLIYAPEMSSFSSSSYAGHIAGTALSARFE
jgi:enoyl-CoA hydratase/carnithine racemase